MVGETRPCDLGWNPVNEIICWPHSNSLPLAHSFEKYTRINVAETKELLGQDGLSGACLNRRCCAHTPEHSDGCRKENVHRVGGIPFKTKSHNEGGQTQRDMWQVCVCI